jgi:hypothetical protein
MDRKEPTYAELEKWLDGYFENANISSFSMDTQGFLMETYCILKRLMADVQTMQKQLEGNGD